MNLLKYRVFDSVLYLLLFLCLQALLLPINTIMPSPGLDPSWVMAIDYSFINNLAFGKEIFFTFGPLGSFWFPHYVYSESTYYVAIALTFSFALVVFLSLYILSNKSSFFVKFISFLLIIIGLKVLGTFVWYLLPMLLIQVTLYDRAKRITILLSYFIVFFLSFSILVKFSHFPTAILAVVLLDIYLILNEKKKIPLYTVLLFIFLIVLFILSGQELGNFLTYLKGSFHTLSGYSESMQIPGPKNMIFAFIVLTLGMLIVLSKNLCSSIDFKKYLFFFVCSLIVFMSFKNGFVRHDGHAMAAFAGLSFVFALLLLYFSNELTSKRFYIAIFLVVLCIVVTIKVVSVYHKKSMDGVALKIFTDLKSKVSRIDELFDKNRVDTLSAHKNNRINGIKSGIDFSGIEGSVDIYPWDQAYLLSHNLEYRPRPMFQSYSVYTPYLIKRNIDFLKSDRAPDTILFAIKAIDYRAPFMMEGASWLELMQRYDVVDIIDEFLVLKRSSLEKSYTKTEIINKSISFGEEISIPKGKDIYITLEAKKTLVGKVVNTLYKSPLLWIELRFNNGLKKKYRFISGIGSSGFILSPSIITIEDFFAYSIDKLERNDIKSIKLINSAKCCYDDKISMTISEIKKNGFKLNTNRSLDLKKLEKDLDKKVELAPELKIYREKLNKVYSDIFDRNENLGAPNLELQNYKGDEILFAHTGIKFKLSGEALANIKDGQGLVKISYSIKENAYLKFSNHGACFRISTGKDVVYNDCIDPKNNISHRGLKEIEIKTLDENKIYLFEVLPMKDNRTDYGWAYWKF